MSEKSLKMCESEQLILLVEKHPCLWNAKHADYTNREVKELAWEQVCQGLFEDWDNVDDVEKASRGTETKKRWGNIRDCYKKEHNRRRTRSSESCLKKHPRRYIYSNLLTFLDTIFEMKARSSENPCLSNDDSLSEKMSEEYELGVPDIIEVRTTAAPKTKRSKASILRDPSPEEAIPSKRVKPFPENDDDDLKFLVSFRSDLKALSNSQKIDFKIGMLELLKNVQRSEPNTNQSTIPFET